MAGRIDLLEQNLNDRLRGIQDQLDILSESASGEQVRRAAAGAARAAEGAEGGGMNTGLIICIVFIVIIIIVVAIGAAVYTAYNRCPESGGGGSGARLLTAGEEKENKAAAQTSQPLPQPRPAVHGGSDDVPEAQPFSSGNRANVRPVPSTRLTHSGDCDDLMAPAEEAIFSKDQMEQLMSNAVQNPIELQQHYDRYQKGFRNDLAGFRCDDDEISQLQMESYRRFEQQERGGALSHVPRSSEFERRANNEALLRA